MNTKMKLTLTKKLLGLLYWCVLDCMSRVDRDTPVGIIDDLQKLELILSKFFKFINLKKI